jgi:peptidylprolyl isomerase
MFDTSRGLEQGAVFDMNAVLPGWAEGLALMSPGDRVRMWIPPALAYQGRPDQPQGTLVYDLELLSIERRPAPPQAPTDVAGPPKNARKTKSGLAYRVLARGKGGDRPGPTSHVRVHYSAWTPDGKLFDSSVVRGKPASFRVDSVIAGWSEGLQRMTVGDKTRLWIPEALAYENGEGGPPGTLVFEVELLEIVR